MVDKATDQVKWNKRDEDGNLQGFFPFNNLPTTLDDCKAIRQAGAAYKFNDFGPDNMYIQEDNPTCNQWKKIKTNISTRCTNNPDQGYIILSCFAGRGLLKEGKQIVLTNEFDKGFYKYINVESDVRALTKKPNLYWIVIFACGRELYNQTQHTGGISLEEALAYSDKKVQ